jgi:hypothetical protein
MVEGSTFPSFPHVVGQERMGELLRRISRQRQALTLANGRSPKSQASNLPPSAKAPHANPGSAPIADHPAMQAMARPRQVESSDT